MRLHSNSGAGRIHKMDASDDERQVEIKDATKSYTVTGKYLEGLWTQSVRVGKEPCLWIFFHNGLILKGVIEKGKANG